MLMQIPSTEFLKLRKIPLTKQRYILDNEPSGESNEDAKASRDTVDKKALDLLEQMRDIVIKDRALNDKVSEPSQHARCAKTDFVMLHPGRKSLRFNGTSLLEA